MSFKPAYAILALALTCVAWPVSSGPAAKAHGAPARSVSGSAAQTTAPATTAAVADSAAPAAEATEATIVYLGKTGTRYHNPGCRYLKGAGKQTTIGDAMKKGYAACNACKAPRVKR